jgi:glycosyltransferase involved in cell wall biosynthesis
MEQTFQDVEIVLIDDDSRESYAGVMEQFKSLHPQYLRNPRNLGAVPNMLYALNHPCDSKYRMVFHEDDLMHPQMLELEIQAMEREPDAVFVGTSMQVFDGTPTPAMRGKRFDNRYERYEQPSDLVRSFLRGASFAFGSAVYRTSAIERAVADMDRFSVLADRPLLGELSKNGTSLFIPAPLLFSRNHGPQDSRGRELTEKHVVELFRYYRSCLPEPWGPEDETLFYSFTTNNFLDSYIHLNQDTRMNVKDFLATCRDTGMVRARSLNLKGMKSVFKYLLSRVPLP